MTKRSILGLAIAVILLFCAIVPTFHHLVFGTLILAWVFLLREMVVNSYHSWKHLRHWRRVARLEQIRRRNDSN